MANVWLEVTNGIVTDSMNYADGVVLDNGWVKALDYPLSYRLNWTTWDGTSFGAPEGEVFLEDDRGL